MMNQTNFGSIPRPPGRLIETIAAALVIAVGMGFGRFAFTGMYPLMVGEGLMTLGQGSLAASANYAGYLVGALSMSRLPPVRAAAIARLATVGTVICLAVLMLPYGPWWIAGIRFIAGVFSALSLIAASVWLLQVIEHPSGTPLLFSGVGLGIFCSAELIALCSVGHDRSGTIWIALALVAAVFSVLAWPVLGRVPPISTSVQRSDVLHEHVLMRPWVLVLAYGLAGFGYIVTATYLPVLIKTAAPDVNPLQVWAGFGIGALPSCFFWHWLHGRVGTKRALFCNLLCQAIGVAMPVFASGLSGYLASALLVGGTFVGTVTIAMPAGRRLAHRLRFNILASMTAAYGVGQIVGPLVAGALVAHTHGFDSSLLSASVALIVAALFAIL